MENRKIKILSIDDNLDNLISINALLKEAFPEAMTFAATNGLRGLELAAKEDPHVILLDIIMPEMDGFEVCRRLKAHDNLCNIPVIFVTALKEDKLNRVKALEYGAEAFISKTIEEIELKAQIKAMIKIRQANFEKLNRELRLQTLVEEKTKELRAANEVTWELLEKLKKENEARKKSEERYRIINEKISDVVWLMDLTGKSLFVSPSIENFTGYTIEEYLSQTIQERFTPASAKLAADSLKQEVNYQLSLKTPQKDYRKIMELEYRCKDGAIKIGEILITPFFDEQNKLSGLHGVTRDITERIKSFQDLQRSEAFLAETQRIANLGSYSFDFIKNIWTSSEIMDAIFGIDTTFDKTLEGWTSIIHPDLQKTMIEYFAQEVIGKTNDFDKVYKIMRINDREERWVHGIGKLRFDLNNQLIEMVGTIQDITELKHVELKLSNERQRLEGILEGTHAGTWEWNIQTGETVFNGRWAEILGYTLEEISPMSVATWEKLSQAEDLIASNILIEKHIKGELDYYEFESRMKHKDGSWIWVLDRGKIMQWNEHGEPLLMLGTHQDITERKNTEAALIKSEENLKHGELISKFGNWKLNTETNYFEISDGARNIFGLGNNTPSLAEIQHMRLPEYDAMMDEAFRALKMERKPYDVEYKIKRQNDGEIIDIQSKAEANIEGTNIFGIVQDISKYKKVEAELRKSEALFKTVVQSSMNLTTLSDKDDLLVFASAQCQAVIGIPAEKYLGKVLPLIVYPEDKEMIREKWETLKEMGEDILHLEYRIINEDGTIRWISHSAKQVFLDGKLQYNQSTIRNITDNKISENKIRQLSQAVEQSPTSIVITDKLGNIVYTNPMFSKSSGYSTEEVLGQNPRILKTEYTPKETYQEMWRNIREGKNWLGEFYNRKKNGEYYWEDVLISAITNDKGEITNFIAIKTDITDRKLEEKKKNLAELELQLKTKTLTSANQQLTDFINVISHNIRGPLVNLSMLVEFLETSQKEEDRKILLEKFKPVINNLNETFDELLESLQVRNDKEITSEYIPIKDLVKTTTDGMEVEIKSAGARIEIDIEEAPVIYGPTLYLKSIIYNLISNSLKYRSISRKPLIKIKTKVVNNNIVLSVTDNGLGIDLSKHKHNLFKIRRVFHEHPDAKGFGLYMTKTQVEAIGGEIWVESIPNEGSTFFIEFKNQSL